MPAKKKTNYISYDLKKLDLYWDQLRDFMDKNPPNLATDRLEKIQTANGFSYKVIATIEQQVKLFMDNLQKMPALLEDINRLRKEVDTDKKEVELRGGADRPGFMDDDEDDDEPIQKKSNKKQTPTNAFDDDEFYENKSELKELPPPSIEENKSENIPDEEEDNEWLEREDQ